MSQRFVVTRLWIKYKGKIYRQGELLPEDFTEREMFRLIYPNRVGPIDLPKKQVVAKQPISKEVKVADDQVTIEEIQSKPPVEKKVKPAAKSEAKPSKVVNKKKPTPTGATATK